MTSSPPAGVLAICTTIRMLLLLLPRLLATLLAALPCV
jgi:hypothetical protein